MYKPNKMHQWVLEPYDSNIDVGMCFVIDEVREYCIGRKKGYDIISLSPLVSRNHGVISLKPDGRLFIKDLKSVNGTYINDHKLLPLREVLLEKDDLVGIGAPSNAKEDNKEIFRLRYRLREIRSETPPPSVEKDENEPSPNEIDDNELNKSSCPLPVQNLTDTNIKNGDSIENKSEKNSNQEDDTNFKSTTTRVKENENKKIVSSEKNCEGQSTSSLGAKNLKSNKYENQNPINEPQTSRHNLLDTAQPETSSSVLKSNKYKNEIPTKDSLISQSNILKTVEAEKSKSNKFENENLNNDPQSSKNNVPTTAQAGRSSSKFKSYKSKNQDSTNDLPISKSNKCENDPTIDPKTSKSNILKTDHAEKTNIESESNKSKNQDSINDLPVSKSNKCENKNSTHDLQTSKSNKCENKVLKNDPKNSKSNILKTDAEKSNKSKNQGLINDPSILKFNKCERRNSTHDLQASKSNKCENKVSSNDPKISKISILKIDHEKSNTELKSNKSKNQDSINDPSISKSNKCEIKVSTNDPKISKINILKTDQEKSNTELKSNKSKNQGSINDLPISKSNKCENKDPAIAPKPSKSGISKTCAEKSTNVNVSESHILKTVEEEYSDFLRVSRSGSKSKRSVIDNNNPQSLKNISNMAENLNSEFEDKKIENTDTSKKIDKLDDKELIKKSLLNENSSENTPDDIKPEIDLDLYFKKPILCETIICSSSDDEDIVIVNKTKNLESKSTNNSFTQQDDDILVISDDDDDQIFPSSQLFEVSVKKEPEKYDDEITGNASPVSSDADDIHFDDLFSIVKKEVHDYEENDQDALDDDDCISWYNKLSQSQDFISASKKEIDSSPEGDKDGDFDEEVEIFDNFQDFKVNFVEDSKSTKNLLDLPEQLKEEEKDLADLLVDEIDNYETSGSSKQVSNLSENLKEAEKILADFDDENDYQLVAKESSSTVDSKISTSEKEEKSKKYVKPPVIDAHFFKKGKRKAHEDKTDKSKETSKKRKSIFDETPILPSTGSVQNSTINIDKSVRNELDKRHKKRRKSLDTYSKDEKIKIQEDRKKKLKELASKTYENKEKTSKTKSTMKPKVKVSSGRGGFLTEDKKSSKHRSGEILEGEPEKKKFKIPKKTNPVVESVPGPSKIRTTRKLSFNDLADPCREKPEEINPCKTKSILSKPNKKKSGRRVTFKEQPEIKYIDKLPGSFWRKVTAKDAPVPFLNNSNYTSDEIIAIVLEWKPLWLEEQKKLKNSPEVSQRPPTRMLTIFNSISDYFDIVKPLMLLELWKSVFRDWCSINAPVKLANIAEIIEKNNSSYLTCHYCVASNEINYPKWGDLILIEYYFIDQDSKVATNKKFAYVISSNKRRLVTNDQQYPFTVTFTIRMKRSQVVIIQERLVRIRFVSRMSPPLRIFKSVSYLENSVLRDLILKPSIQEYKVSKSIQMTTAIEDKLNHDQLMCIFEAYQICCREEPGIYLIQGPPGTGKSFVIKNLIRQLLSDETKSHINQKPKILLCAPSNGAVDEITKSLLDMRSKLDKNDRFKMIRVGPPSSITNPKVKSISLQDLVYKHLQTIQNNNLNSNSCMGGEYNFLIQKQNTLKNKIMSLEARKLDFSSELQILKKVELQIEQLKTNPNLQQDKRREERDAETVMIEKADIICTTLSSCIGSCSRLEELVVERKIQFTCCIIDEATQSNEQESLIPIMLGIKRFVLVGDPEQLAPTTISQEAKDLGHGNSLFNRIKSCLDHLPENPIRMLTEQYRMHSEICKFPNKKFYGGKLKTADLVEEKSENILDPVILFSLSNNIDKHSEYLNKTEANLVLLLTDIVLRRTKYNVGIITPYSKQKEYLINKYKASRAKENKENIEDEDRHFSRVSINTVDGFQGQERDVIIISSVRYKSNIFLNDHQRLNVALTRAKHAVFICAHSNLFKTQSIWQELESDAKSRNFFYPISEKDTTDERYISELILKH